METNAATATRPPTASHPGTARAAPSGSPALAAAPGGTNGRPMFVLSARMIRAGRTGRYRHGLDATPGCLDEPPPGRDAVRFRGDEPPEPPAGVRGPDDLLLGGATYACPSCERPAERSDAALRQFPVVGRGGSSW